MTYSAHIDTRVSFQALWDKKAERLAINIKPVETTLEDVNVVVCFLTSELFCFIVRHGSNYNRGLHLKVVLIFAGL